MCVPLIYGSVALGVVHIVSAHRHQFFPSEIEVLSTIALYLASLVVNAELLAHYDRRLAELSLLNRISTAMQAKIELADVLNTFLDETIQVMGADAGLVFLLDARSGELRVEARLGFPESLWQNPLGPGEGIPGWVVKHGRVYVSPTPLAQGAAQAREHDSPDREIAARICVPLVTEGQTLGALYIATRTPRMFDEDDMRFLSIVCSQAAVIIRRALLYARAER
ncbi:MAG: GAF domain-containing protein [Chloroflexi bacterium]|nr:GAF domain-containing protein [Chloroflexota bacterium]